MSANVSPQLHQSSTVQVDAKHTPLLTPLSTPSSGHRRQTSSTGGGRAWSEEEESYLIETRQHKMPYKHIAAHLQKTELACRLHYHQLSFGTKRRRRNSSISSIRSLSSTAGREASRPAQVLPAISPPASPESLSATRAPSPYEPIAILPKPTLHREHYASAPPASRSSSDGSLHLISEDVERFDSHSRINRDRLNRIYDAHRSHFWAMIARDYGEGVAPAALEDVWRRYNGPSDPYPPTPPSRSPKCGRIEAASTFHLELPGPQGFLPVNLPKVSASAPSRSSFSISELLTEDREVRSPPERK